MNVFLSRMGSVVVAAALLFSASPVLADASCVQRQLNQLGFDVGPPDGAIGKKTKAAAAEYAEQHGVKLTALGADNTAEWCTALRRAVYGPDADNKPVVNGLSAFDFDVTTPPKDAMGKDALERYWRMPETDKECFVYRKSYGAPLTLKLKALPASTFEAVPQTIFPAALPLPACVPKGPQSARLQEPVTSFDPPPPLREFDAKTVNEYANVYGRHDSEFLTNMAGYWFASRLASFRAFGDEADSRALIDTMIEWAKGKALTRNIQVGGNQGPVIYSLTTTFSTILNAYAETSPLMTAKERAVIGPWMSGFMVKVAGTTDTFRTQNHAAGWALMIAEWGLVTGNADAVQHAIERYKHAINDMRPDGVFVIDHSRGGSGLSYQNLMTGDLVLLAALLRTSLDIDLFSYSPDGRSIRDAVKYTLDAMADPVAANMKNALPCEASYRTIDDPVVDLSLNSTFATSAYMPAFALLNPESDITPTILKRFSRPISEAVFHPVLGAPPLCLFALTLPGATDLAVRPAPVAIHTKEWKSWTGPTDSEFNAIWEATIVGAKSGEDRVHFNVDGTYVSVLHDVRNVRFVINTPLGRTAPAGLAACGGGKRTEVYDDDHLHRVILDVERDASGWMVKNVGCIEAAVDDDEVAFAVRFLATSFDKLARDLVASGEISSIDNDGLRQWIEDIAAGRISVHS